MIGLFVKIPFHSQLKKADPGLISELNSTIDSAAEVFGAHLCPRDESFFLAFDEAEGCARLRTAEAARSLETRLHGLSPRLHGWDILLVEGQGAEELQREATILWSAVDGDGLFIAEPAKELFGSYLGLEVGEAPPRVLVFPYADPPLPESYRPPPPAPTTLERFIDEVGRHGIGESGADLLLAVGPGSSPSDYLEDSLRALYKDSAASFLRIHASTGEDSPFGPILASLSREGPGSDLAILPAPDRVKLEELAPVAAFLDSSPYRRAYSQAIKTRFRIYVSLRIKLYARSRKLAGIPPVIILEGLDRLSRDSLDLLGEVLAESLESEGLVLYATATLPSEDLGSLKRRMVSAPPPSPVAIAQTALFACRDGASEGPEVGQGQVLSSAAEGDGFRLGLALRLACQGQLPNRRLDTTELASLALASLPAEFSELLLALALSEGVMDPTCLEDFLTRAGFVSGIRPLLHETLIRLGFLAQDRPPRLARPEAAAAAAQVAPEGGKRVRLAFQGRLIALHDSHRICSSAALFWKVRESLPAPAAASLFYLDCLSADALYGISQEEGEGDAPPLEGLSAFIAAYSAGNASSTAKALEVLDRGAARPGADPLELPLASLCRGFDDYARGQGSQAAGRAKPALMGLHSLRARQAEAKAHRLLGLSSLAQSQVQDGADYLSNAYELAEELPDPLECILSAYAEAGALLVLGDLKRAAWKGQAAASWAKASFRADWETACDFLAGRVAFELGRYAEAEEHFGRVRASARVYEEPRAGARAEIWSGRAAAYGGVTGKAADLLGRYRDDAEAAWFLSELYYFQGRKEDAASEAASALGLLELPEYSPADRTSWASGFDCLEGRCLGYGRERSYLADQIGAFAAFTSGLVEGRPETVLAIAALTREERLATLHPQAHLYHFYCYLNLAAAGGGPLDPGTVLSKAFKALQTRTARLDEAGLKDDYYEKNRWNREILAEARKHKLI